MLARSACVTILEVSRTCTQTRHGDECLSTVGLSSVGPGGIGWSSVGLSSVGLGGVGLSSAGLE